MMVGMGLTNVNVAKDLIRRLLVRDPRERLTADQCLLHEWVQSAEADDDSMNSNEIHLDKLREYNMQRRNDKAVMSAPL